MKEKVLIPTRGVIALDIINSLNSMGMETLLMHSPEDSLSLPVKLADRSYQILFLAPGGQLPGQRSHPGKSARSPRRLHPSRLRFSGRKPRVRQALPREQHPLHRPRQPAVLAAVEDKIKLRRDRRRPRPAGPEVLRTDQEPPRFRGLRQRLQLPDHHQAAERLGRPGHPRGRLPARRPGTGGQPAEAGGERPQRHLLRGIPALRPPYRDPLFPRRQGQYPVPARDRVVDPAPLSEDIPGVALAERRRAPARLPLRALARRCSRRSTTWGWAMSSSSWKTTNASSPRSTPPSRSTP